MAIGSTFKSEVTLADAMRLVPKAIDLFEKLGIDYSCQGAKSLADAAQEAGYSIDDIISPLESLRNGRDRSTDWFQKPIPSLLLFLTEDHRRTLSRSIPQLRAAIETAAGKIGDNIELRRIRILFAHLADTMSSHVVHEERELFPCISHLDAANNDLSGVPRMRISQRVLRELVEHQGFRDRVRTLHALAERLPAGAAVDALQRGLLEFSNEVNRHMHLENNVLYPRAIEIENGLRRNAATAVVD